MKIRRCLGLALTIVSLLVSARAEPVPAEFPDVLTYKNGDRVQGRVVRQTDGQIVFQSLNLGEIRVRADSVTLTKVAPATPAPLARPSPAPAVAAAAKPAPTAAPAAKPAETSGDRTWWRDQLSLALFAARLHLFFGGWDGRIAFSTEMRSETTDRDTIAAELRLHRKWKTDEVQFNQRYDYSTLNDERITDILRSNASWRHDISPRWFAQYRPSLEWNRTTVVNGVLSSYFLMQHDIGAGLTLLSVANRKLRLGFAQDFFDNWNKINGDAHTGRITQSGFAEAEFKLPWRMSLTQRAVYYYAVRAQHNGWENQLELSKKFTETLSTAIRHELRRDNPDGISPDQTFMRILLGLDF